MVREVVENLRLEPGDIVLDATLGGGGHAAEILKGILPGGQLIGIDRDISAIEFAKRTLKDYAGSVTLVNADFRDLDKELQRSGVQKLSGALFDLGVSSFHLDDPRRGFSVYGEGPLDFRFDRSQSLTGSELVNEWPEEELRSILWEYANERFARAIARRICQMRVH